MSSNSLLSALDHAGIKYSTRTSPRGIDYAGFIWSTQDGDSTQLTAILEEGVARFTAHTMRVNLAPLTLHDRARKLPLGAAYFSPDDGHAELSVGLFINDRLLNPEQVVAIIDYINCAQRYLEGGTDCCQLPLLFGEEFNRGADIVDLLSLLGHAPIASENGTDVEIKLSEELRYQSNIIDLGNGWIQATSHCNAFRKIQFDEDKLLLVQKLQRWAASGRFVIHSDGQLSVEVSTPCFEENRDTQITWTLSQAVLLLRTAAEHYHLVNPV